jgi:hypothetical protein
VSAAGPQGICAAVRPTPDTRLSAARGGSGDRTLGVLRLQAAAEAAAAAEAEAEAEAEAAAEAEAGAEAEVAAAAEVEAAAEMEASSK